MIRLIAATLLLGGLALAGTAAPAAAHLARPTDQSAQTSQAGVAEAVSEHRPRHLTPPVAASEEARGSPVAVTGILLALAAVLWAIATRHRLVASALSLVLLILTFESAVHSVHHLGSTEESRCVVASAATHVQGTVGEPVLAPAAPISIGEACAVETVPLASLPWRAWRGRAPPSLPTS